MAVQGRGGYLPPAPHGPERGPGLPRAGSPVLAQASASPRRAQTCMPPPAEAQTPRLLARPPSLPQPLPRRCPPPPSVAGAGGRQAPPNPPYPPHPLHHQRVLLSGDERLPRAPEVLTACVLTLGNKGSVLAVCLSRCLSVYHHLPSSLV